MSPPSTSSVALQTLVSPFLLAKGLPAHILTSLNALPSGFYSTERLTDPWPHSCISGTLGPEVWEANSPWPHSSERSRPHTQRLAWPCLLLTGWKRLSWVASFSDVAGAGKGRTLAATTLPAVGSVPCLHLHVPLEQEGPQAGVWGPCPPDALWERTWRKGSCL